MTIVNESSSDSSLPPDFETPGSILRSAREKAGLPTGDLAKQLNLSVSKLEALEQDQYDKLASDVFVQGYLRRCAKLLGVDDDLIVERYKEYIALSRQSDTDSEVEQTGTRDPSSLPRWVLPAAIFVLAIVVLVFIYVRTSGSDATGPIRGPVQEEQVQEPAPVTDEENEPGVQAEPQATPASPRAEDSIPDAVEQVVAGRTSTQAAPRQAEDLETSATPDEGTTPEVSSENENTLAFAFSDECWVEVRDASGAVVHANLAKAGETLSVVGEAPFSVMLGNARAASLSYKGELVSVNARPGQRTARLTVGS